MTNDKIEQFEDLCKAHDLTYTYSDDHSVYMKGSAQYKAIKELAEHIPNETAAEIWNKYVAIKLNESCRNDYLWKLN
jgi:hypothetical protein